MICTRCEVWEVARQDNFCSWCGAQWVGVQATLEPWEVHAASYPPPVRLVIRNTSRESTVEIIGIAPDADWISLLPHGGLPIPIDAGEQATFLLDVDTFAAGSETSARIDVRVAFGGGASAPLRLVRGEEVSQASGDPHLPSADWQLLNDRQVLQTANSTSCRVVDTSSGTSYRLREYRAPAAPSHALLGKFIATAKSLRNVPLAPEWVWFAYTVAGRCYTVGRDISGRRLDGVVTPGKATRVESRKWLRAVLVALRDLHAQAAAQGEMYHGNLELDHILVADATLPGEEPTNETSGASVVLMSGLYLEHVLTDSPYSPEFFIESDLRHAGLAILTLLSGTDSLHATPAAREGMLAAVSDTAVGATLDFLVAPAAKKASSAQQVLTFFDALVRAETENHRTEFQKAYALSGSPRLLPIIASLEKVEVSVEQSRRQAAEHAARQRLLAEQETARRAAETWARPAVDPPFMPVPMPPPPVRPGSGTLAVWKKRVKLTANFVVRSVRILTTAALVTLTMAAILLVYRVGSWLRESKPSGTVEAPSLSFTATPNPTHRGQRTTLNWTTKGYARVLLDGTPVGATGFRMVYPGTTVTYHLEAFTRTGAHKTEDLRLLVVGSRPKPKASVEEDPAPSQDP